MRSRGGSLTHCVAAVRREGGRMPFTMPWFDLTLWM